MSAAYTKNEVDIQSSVQSVRHNLISKEITLQTIKQRQIAIGFVNQLDIPPGLKDLIINHGFTLDLLLSTQPTDLAKDLGIDKDVAKLIWDAARRLRAGRFETKVAIER
ncbi:MAG TPA: hypothetical protein VFI73_13050 [Candidatus Nitrosopolaris sp.]|nr:hypothetical protein [Candidatus Nitrosopolaris sp.]